MDIDLLANSITYSQEEQDLLKWIKDSGKSQIRLGQKIVLQKETYYIVGGTTSGYIYLQKFQTKTSKTHIRYDSSRPKIIIFHTQLFN